MVVSSLSCTSYRIIDLIVCLSSSNLSESPLRDVYYYESIKRELQIKPIYECRCDERLKTKAEEFTRLTYTQCMSSVTGLLGGLEHLKIETRLIDEKCVNVMGEYVT